MPRGHERFDPNWEWFDEQVGLAAESESGLSPSSGGPLNGSRPASGPSRSQAPGSAASGLRFLLPPSTATARAASFWRENRDLPRLPVRQWEIWNEENIITFSREPDPVRFARLIEISGASCTTPIQARP